MKKKLKSSLIHELEILELEQKKILLKYNKILKKVGKLNKNILVKKKIVKNNLVKESKRLNKVIENSYKYSLENVIKETLPVIDSLNKAIELKNSVSNVYINNFLYSLESVLKNFMKSLSKFKICEIKQVNVKFDPNIHQAISVIYSKKFKDNFVANIIQKGYLLHNRLLRPAMVIVNKKYK
ncbi:nucleotide exchange factor GrpE [Buchnera aphidicola (Chaitoregma tattakana)]|uniref:nucleotide exchange factor GrpE n=1 Tax=Buchnera aphidicola TaxID=9 RepID=UPI0031B87ED1